jgi:hypothetical protein
LPRFSLVRLASFAPNAVLDQLQGQQGRRGQPRPDTRKAGARLTIMPLPPAPAANTVSQITATTNCGDYDIGHADESRCPVRLQRATFPGYQVGRITQGQLGAAGLFGNFGAQLGLGSSSETAVSLTLSNIQDISLDAWRLSQLRNKHWDDVAHLIWAEDLLALLREMRPDRLEDACNGNATALAQAGIEVMMINRVIYAGGLKYGFTRNASTAIRAAMDLQSVLAGQPQAPQIPTLPAPTAVPAVTATTPPAAAGERLAGVLQGLTGYSGGVGRAGVNLSFGVGTYGNLTLSESFNRPIAVGAGSRLRFTFHEMLAGRLVGGRTLEGPTLEDGQRYAGTLHEFRFQKASEFCEAALGRRFDSAGLARAMGVVIRG